MPRFQISPLIAVAIDKYGDIKYFGLWTPGQVLRSKFDEPMRRFDLVARFPSREDAAAALANLEKKGNLR